MITFLSDWSRFRDDCFSPWFGSHDDLVRFTDWLNSLSPSVKFTVKHSDEQLEMLELYCVSLMAALSLRYIQNPQMAYVFTASIITLLIYAFAYSFWRCTQD